MGGVGGGRPRVGGGGWTHAELTIGAITVSKNVIDVRALPDVINRNKTILCTLYSMFSLSR